MHTLRVAGLLLGCASWLRAPSTCALVGLLRARISRTLWCLPPTRPDRKLQQRLLLQVLGGAPSKGVESVAMERCHALLQDRNGSHLMEVRSTQITRPAASGRQRSVASRVWQLWMELAAVLSCAPLPFQLPFCATSVQHLRGPSLPWHAM